MTKIKMPGCLILLLLYGCYGINEKTSEIGDLNTLCLRDNAWDEIEQLYLADSIDIQDPIFLGKLADFDILPLNGKTSSFCEEPRELIGISSDYYTVSYVYNPEISNQILNGLSPALSGAEKKRIRNRVQRLLLPYQCEKGRQQSLEMMNEQLD